MPGSKRLKPSDAQFKKFHETHYNEQKKHALAKFSLISGLKTTHLKNSERDTSKRKLK